MKKEVSGMSRRSFLKGAAATVAGAAAISAMGMPASTVKAEEDDVMTAEKWLETKWSFEIPPEPIADDMITKEYTADIVVVGAGIAGLCTAVKAKEDGADVIVFTAGLTPTGRGGSNHAAGSKKLDSLGIEWGPEQESEIIKVEQTSGTYLMDKKKWAKWLNNSRESVDWMIDKMESQGLKTCVEFGYNDADGILTVPPASHNFWTDDPELFENGGMGVFGALFGAPMQAKAYAAIFTNEQGGQLDFHTKALYLIREDDNTGRVSGVVAYDWEAGEYVKYNANKAVVLATGDFSRDPDMMAKYAPWVYQEYKDSLEFFDPTNEDPEYINRIYTTGLEYAGLMPGDGQKMGLWIGAAWQKTFPVAPMINVGVGGPALDNDISNFLGLNIDSTGKRFQNEATNFGYGAFSILQLPDQKAYGIWDADYAFLRDSWDSFGCCVGYENGRQPQTSEALLESWKAGRYAMADTIEELLEQMGFEGEAYENALKTIEDYNRYAEQGLDEEFHKNPAYLQTIKTPPFFGSSAGKGAGACTFLTMCGGLRTNENMQVCDANDVPIEGLYNTGIMTGDFYANSYNFVIFGQNLGGTCCTLSYLLGKDLAKL